MIRYILTLVLLFPAAALAQEPRYSCPGQTQLDFNFCARDAWKVEDDRLNRIWADAKRRADARGGGQALLAEQRAWLKRRDADCDPELSSGGSADQMFYWSCMEEQTRLRNAELGALD